MSEELTKSTITTEVPKKMKVGKKTLSILEENDPLRKLFNETLPEVANMEDFTPGTDVLKAKFQLIMVEPYISKTVVARIMRPRGEFLMFAGVDFIIEFSGSAFDVIDTATKKVVIEHELRHVKIDFDDNGDPKYGLVDHNVKDFFEVIKRHGVEWFETLRTKTAVALENKSKVKESDDEETKATKESELKAKQQKLMAKITI